jgi:hypothetical protein
MYSNKHKPFSLESNKTESGWGPNAVFRFPQEGGTGKNILSRHHFPILCVKIAPSNLGAIWTKVAKLLPVEKQRYRSKVIRIPLVISSLIYLTELNKLQYYQVASMNPASKIITLEDGKVYRYNKLLTTIPLGLSH